MSRYCVIDLEMCHVPKDKREEFPMGLEIIQIGAVLLDERLETAGTFMTYVKPQFGAINDFIENLTGISAQHTENAPVAEEALMLFLDWLPDDAVILSWGDCDREQIERETEAKAISQKRLQKYFESWIDCQAAFGRKIDVERQYNLAQALNICDIFYDENIHDALVDAQNTALLFAKMQREPNLQLSSYYQAEEDAEGMTDNPFAALLKGMDVS